MDDSDLKARGHLTATEDYGIASETRTPTDVADMDDRWATIQLKLKADADALVRQGTLVAKGARGRRVWAARYAVKEGGRRVHKSIYIGDQPELVERDRRLLEEYRATGRWAEEVEGDARLAARAGGIVRRYSAGRTRSR